MEAAQGRSQAAACGVSGCASTVECSAYGFMRVRTSVDVRQQHRATKAQTICLKLLKRYALSWTWFKPGRRLRLVVGHLESGSLRGLRCAVCGSPSACAPAPRAVWAKGLLCIVDDGV